ncbi:MAG: hypothetical protein OXH75_12460 [Acidobacteria bacterium]|nr:hypothetical protein [Acidobacteriota bacterium]
MRPRRESGLALLAAVAAACAAVMVPVWLGSGAWPVATGASAQEPDPGSGRRLVAVIGDLHLGLGRDEAGEWRSDEDFRWADEFALFLDALDAERGGATDLILNGDTFDLTRSGDAGCAHGDPALGCTEQEALDRLDRVLAAHRDVVDSLAAFATSGANRVVLVPGEHDAALLFPAVGRRVEAALGGPEGRAEVAADGYWQSDDGQVHVEHGHQIGWRVDRFEDWPEPFVERGGRRHLARPEWARAVDGFFDALEARYPVIDNFADEGAGLTHGLAAEGTSDLGPEAAALLRYVLFRMPWQQFRVDLDAGDVQPPSWDLTAVREQGISFLVDSLPNDHRFKPLARQAQAAGRLDALMASLGDDELIALCDYRAASRRARRRFERVLTQFDPQGPPVRECPRHPDSRGGLFDYFWRTRDRIYGDRLLEAQAGRPPDAPPIAVFVHNHTLLVDWRQRVLELTRLGRTVIVDGFSPVRNALAPVVINGGPWQRTITPVQFGRLRAEHGLSDAELLEALRPEHLPPCYGFVRIDPYEGTPALPAIRYWRATEEGTGWEMAGTCGRQPVL